jgi:hypothetical protein
MYNKKIKVMTQTTIKYYEGSVEFYTVNSANEVKQLNKYVLSTFKHKCASKKRIDGELWAEVFENGKSTTRFIYNQKLGLRVFSTLELSK